MEASPRRRRRGALSYAALSLLLGLVGGFAGAAVATTVFDDGDDANNVAVAPADASAAERVAAAARPSVVTIVGESSTRRRDGRVVQETSLGSGVIIDPRGFIVTNEHVIRDATRLTVILDSGEERRAVLVAHDRPFTDLAVVKVEGEGRFPAMALGNSDALRLGQPLVSIGHSLRDFRASVTTGVVSGLHRSWPRDEAVMEDLIQTDAAINHGNSGGALLNERGELVGLNTTVIRQTEQGETVEGIALALSSETIRDVALPIIELGRKPRPTLGIEHVDVNPETAAANGLPPVQAALVTAVAPNSPAERGELRVNDIIIGFDGADLTPERPYVNALMRLPTDRPVEVRIVRNGARRIVKVTPVVR